MEIDQRFCKYCYSTGFHPRKSDGVFIYCSHCQKGRISKNATKEQIDNAIHKYVQVSLDTEHKTISFYRDKQSDQCPYCRKKMNKLYKHYEGKINPIPSLFCLHENCTGGQSEWDLCNAGWQRK